MMHCPLAVFLCLHRAESGLAVIALGMVPRRVVMVLGGHLVAFCAVT